MPDFALAHFNLGKAYYMNNMKTEASAEWDRAHQIDPRLDTKNLPGTQEGRPGGGGQENQGTPGF
jgi:hypothetical protein